MRIRSFTSCDWNRFKGCQSTDDGREPQINADRCTITDFPIEYLNAVAAPKWDTGGSMAADWSKWLDDPEVMVLVDRTGVGICLGPWDAEWMQLECSYDLGLLVIQSLNHRLSLAALLEMGFKPYNWNSGTVGGEAEAVWLKNLLTKKEVEVTLNVTVMRTIVLADIHPDAIPQEVAATGLRSILGHHGYEVYGDICEFEI